MITTRPSAKNLRNNYVIGTLWRIFTILLILATVALTLLTTQSTSAHNLDASAVYVYFDPDTQAMLDARIASGWQAGMPLIAVGDEIGVIIKAVPDNGTSTGVGGYTTFYVPNGVAVIDVAFLAPNGAGGYDRIDAKGQALMPNVGAGGGPTVNLTTLPAGDLLRGPNIAGVTAPMVNSANVNNGTLPGVYGDLGIFFSTAPQTAYGTYSGGTLRNNSGDTVGSRTPLGTPLNEWDAWQLAAFGIAGTTNPAYPTSPRVDANGRGNTLWGLANAVAGPESGYAWQFNKAVYDACAGSPTGTITAACIEAATREFGPWQRIQYPGSQIAYDIPGDTRLGQFVGGLDASTVGHDLSTTNPLPAGTNAVRFAFGQLTNQRPEFAWVKMKVNDFTSMLDPTGCPVWYVDTFGGDAGGDDNGKDHIWRYYDPNSVLLNGCLAAGKPATRDIVKVGDFFQYKLKLYNGGNVDLVNVVVTDQLPTGVTFISAVPAQNSGPNPLRWVIGSLQRGQSWEATVTVRASGTGLLRNAMTVTGTTSGGDPISTTVTEVTMSGLLPYLRQEKSVTPAAAAPGDLVDYTITVDNIGTGASGSPVRIIEYLPNGFIYNSLVSATINGAAITPVVDSSNPRQPIFTFPAAVQAGKSLRLTFKARISPDVEPGSYCNSFTSTSPGRLTTGSLACVQVAGGLIGDTIWRDWNGNGVQDPGEEGIAGVTVKLYDSTGTTLLATTTTGANGRYYFPGLVAGTYVVEVNNGSPLTGTVQTGDPDATLDNRHTVILDENEQYLTADFGYQPAGSGDIGDMVFADIGNDGVFNVGTDNGISGVTVYLYADVDGDSSFTPGVDALIATTTTGACPGINCGIYNFSGLAEGFAYIVVVDPADAVLAAYFNDAPFQASTPNPQFVSNLSGTHKDADFGFWEIEPALIGDQVFLDNDGNGLYGAGDTPLSGVTVNLYRNGQLVATTVTGPDGTYFFDMLGPGSYTVVVDAASAGIPAGCSASVGQYNVTLAPGDTYLDADFPFVPLISKSVDRSYVNPSGSVAERTLTFGVTVNYPGHNYLEDVKVIDPLPTGVTYVGGSANAGGTYGPYASQPGTPGEDAAPAIGMAIYNNNNDTFRYRTWNVDDGFSAETNAVNMGTRIQMMAGASSPTTAERVIAFTHAGPQISAAIWNGTAWTAVPAPPANGTQGRLTTANLTANSNLYWGAAVAYEQSSGHLMLVWNDDANTTAGNDDELRYVTRESGVWGTVTSLATAANQPQNLRIAARPNSDQLALVYSSASGADYIRLWSGTAWSSETALDTTGGSLTSVNVAYEAQSGRALVVYGKPTATSVNLFYRIWDGSSWSAETSITPPAGVTTQPQWTAIASDPFSNRIAVGVVTSGGRTWLSVWNGSAWVNTIQATATALLSTAQNVAVAFETLSGDLLAAYGVNSAPTAQVRYRTWTWNPVTQTGAWSAETSGPSATNGNPNVIMLTRSPSTNRVMMAINTSSSRANYVSWDGSAWDETVTDAAGNTQVTGQQPMIYLWNRASISEESTATSVTVTPTTAAPGGAITVKVELKSARTINNVTPSLSPQNGSATCTTADTIPATVSAGVLKTFTYTCTPTSLGEIHFVAAASSAGGYDFPDAKSNTVLVSANGASNVVTWNLGSTTPAQAGSTATSKYVYAFRGAGTNAFWAYNPATNVWNNPLDPADNAGVNIGAGGALATDGSQYIYALQGGGTQGFHRYDALSNSWSARASTGVNINTGGALVYLNGKLYAFAGGNTTGFRIYDVAGNTWSAGAAVPQAVGQGGTLATDGRYIYGLRGNRKPEFYRYDPETNTWAALLRAPANIGKGGSLVFANGALYALRGDGQKGFYRYNIAANTWTTLAGTPGNIAEGGALTFDGQYLRAFQGKNTTFYRYNLATNVWETRAAAPAATNWGGALTYLESGNVTRSRMQAYPTLVTDGPGNQQVKVRLTLTAESTVNSVSAGTISVLGVNGASATCDAPVLISADNALTSPADEVVFEWTCTVTAGSIPGSIRFNANATGSGPTTFGTATSNSVLLTPPLTWQAVVNSPVTVNVVENTALLNSDQGIDPTASNTTETYTTATIGDRVWADLNGDGVQDAGEYGLAGVEVCVYASDGVTLVACDVTDALGSYRIVGLPPGNYVVRTNPDTYPAGFISTTAGSHNVTLAAGQQYDTADFGLRPPGTGRIGDTIWLDSDNDGVQDSGEAGLTGITVTLQILVGGVWTPVATTVTDADGQYTFTGLAAGDYRVVVDAASQVSSPYANGTFNLGDVMAPTYDYDGTGTPHVALVTLATDSFVVDSVDFGYNWRGSIGDYVWWDDDRNGLQNEGPDRAISGARVMLYFDADGDGILNLVAGDYEILRTFTAADGRYLFTNLPPGNYMVDVYEDSLVTNGVRNVVPTTDDYMPVVLGPGNMDVDTADFGYFVGARVEALVFWDENQNGVFENGEHPLAGIPVTLRDEIGNIVGTAVTGASGKVVFLVPEGYYTISYDLADVAALYPALGTLTTPTSFAFFAQAGEDGMQRYDFGVDNTGAVGDRVWNDADGDGVQDPGELGLPGVTVNLYDADGNWLAATVTDEFGNYLFTGLPDGNYLVRVDTSTVPAGYINTYDEDNGTTNPDSKTAVTVSGGAAHLTADFGYYNANTYTVSGTIWHDANGNGAMDDGLYLGGVTVCLYDNSGRMVACTTTDNNGNYTFPGIPNGGYTIRVDSTTLPNAAYVPTYDPNGISTPHITSITVNNANVTNQNFGYQERLGSIRGTLCDGSGNGFCDPGEPTLAGITVIMTWAGPDGILGSADDVIFTTVTDDNGDYLFADLLPGLYQITKINPAGYPFSLADADGGNPNNISVFLPAGGNRIERDFELGPRAGAIGDRIWLDENGDGLQDAGEAGIANVVVELYDSTNTLIVTTTTDFNGSYLFAGLLPGAYTVRVDTSSMPAGLAANPTYDEDGTATAHASAVTLLAGQTYTTADFGYNWVPAPHSANPPAGAAGAIGDRIWIDADGDGLQDAGEAGLGGVPVAIYYDSNGDGIYDALYTAAIDQNGATGTGTTVTNPDGSYVFYNLPPGAYVIVVNGGTALNGYTQTGDPDGVLDNQSNPIVLAPGDVYVNADFGYQPVGPSSSISGTVYADLDASATRDGIDYGVAGVTVALLDADGNVIATTTTDANGYYEFPGLPTGNYTVWVNDTGNLLGGLYQTEDPDAMVNGRTPVTVNGSDDVTDLDFGYTPLGHAAGLGLIGDTIFLDRDGDGEFDHGEGMQGVTVRLYTADGKTLLATTATDANGNYAFGGLADGSYLVRVDTATLPDNGAGLTNFADPDGATAHESILAISGGNRVNLDQDFGYVATNPNSISGTIWNDVNADGTLGGSEAGRFTGVTVVLRDSNGNIVATTSTDSSGNYSFTGLPAGKYSVDVTDTANVLDGLWHSLGTAGMAGQSQSDPYTVEVSGGSSYTVDFGYYGAPASLGNYIWLDVNGNGIQDGTEPGLTNVRVTLTIAYPNGDITTVTAVTDAAGFYSFANLLLDESFNSSSGSGQPTYSVSVATTQPALTGLVPTQIGQGNGANDSGDPAGEAASVVQGQYDDTIDFGFFGLVDSGNLPDTYNTLFQNSGPGHVAGPVILGTTWISDTNGLPNGTPGDNDSVTRSPNDLWRPGNVVSLNVSVTGGDGYLVAWFDWNGNGQFDAGEMINFGQISDGINNLTLPIPNNYTTGARLNVRFRLYESEPANPLPTGIVMGGEVEDYVWEFSPTAVTLATFSAGQQHPVLLLSATGMLAMLLLSALAMQRRRRVA